MLLSVDCRNPLATHAGSQEKPESSQTQIHSAKLIMHHHESAL